MAVEDAIFTKEDIEIFRGGISKLERETEKNFIEYLNNLSNDDNNIKSLVDFIILRKTGSLKLQHKQMILNSIDAEIMKIYEKKDDIIKAIPGLASFQALNLELGTLPKFAFAAAVVVINVAQIAFKLLSLTFLTASFLELELLLIEKNLYKLEILNKPLIEF